MNYNVQQLFPTPIYQTVVDNYDAIQNEILECIKEINFEMNPSWGQTHYLSDPTFKEHLLERYKLENFIEEVDTHIRNYCKEINFPFREYRISSSWLALFKKGNYGHIHAHGTSDISAVYYFSKPEDSSDIFFQSPIVSAESSLCFFAGRAGIPATQGTLLLFPGWLKHGIDANRSDDDRISLSFDVIFDRSYN